MKYKIIYLFIPIIILLTGCGSNINSDNYEWQTNVINSELKYQYYTGWEIDINEKDYNYTTDNGIISISYYNFEDYDLPEQSIISDIKDAEFEYNAYTEESVLGNQEATLIMYEDYNNTICQIDVAYDTKIYRFYCISNSKNTDDMFSEFQTVLDSVEWK